MDLSIFLIIISLISILLIQLVFIFSLKKDKKRIFAQNINLQQENDKNLQRIFHLSEYSIDGIAIFDKDGSINFFNQSFLTIWDIDQKFFKSNKKIKYVDFINKVINENKISPKNIDDFKKWHDDIFVSLKKEYNEFIHLNDGRTIRILIIPNKEKEILFIYQDITDRLKIRMELNLIEMLFENTLNFFEKPIIILSQNFKIYSCNQHVKNFLKNENLNEVWQKNIYSLLSDFIKKPSNLNYFLNQVYEFKQNNRASQTNDLFLSFKEKKLFIRIIKINDFLVFIFNIDPILIKNLFIFNDEIIFEGDC